MNRTFGFALVTLLGLACVPGLATAQLSGSATNLSATQNIPHTQATSVVVRWSLQRSMPTPAPPPVPDTGPGEPPRIPDPATGEPARTAPDSGTSAPQRIISAVAGATVTSTFGRFTDATGTMIPGTAPMRSSLSRAIGAAGTAISFTETVQIPREVLYAAARANIRQIQYRREFTDCPGVGCSTVSLAVSYTVTGGSAAGFAISAYSIRFADGSLAALIGQDQPLQAELRLSVTGTGTVRGVWEIATPGSTAGTPFFRTLQLVTRLVSSNQDIRLLSPDLPSQQTGNHLIRFRLLEPELPVEPPTLQYVVIPSVQAEPAVFELLAPAPDAEIDGDTVFEWQPVPGVTGYKLELTAERPTARLQPVIAAAGVLLQSSAEQARLNASQLQNLEADTTYWWHVLAIDDQGHVVGASPWSTIRPR